MEINDILLEWSYRLKKGYPTMEDGKFTEPSELKVLHEILKENGIKEMPSFETPVTVEERSPLLEDEELETLDAPSLPDNAKEPDTEFKNKASAEEVRKKFEEAVKAAEVLGPKTLGKMYNRLAAFSLYLPIKNALDGSGYTKVKDKKGKVKYDMPEKIANELQMKLEDLNAAGYKDFIDFLNIPKKDKPEFLNEWWLVSSHTSYEGAENSIEEQHKWELNNGYRFKVVDRGSESVIKRSVW